MPAVGGRHAYRDCHAHIETDRNSEKTLFGAEPPGRLLKTEKNQTTRTESNFWVNSNLYTFTSLLITAFSVLFVEAGPLLGLKCYTFTSLLIAAFSVLFVEAGPLLGHLSRTFPPFFCLNCNTSQAEKTLSRGETLSQNFNTAFRSQYTFPPSKKQCPSAKLVKYAY